MQTFLQTLSTFLIFTLIYIILRFVEFSFFSHSSDHPSEASKLRNLNETPSTEASKSHYSQPTPPKSKINLNKLIKSLDATIESLPPFVTIPEFSLPSAPTFFNNNLMRNAKREYTNLSYPFFLSTKNIIDYKMSLIPTPHVFNHVQVDFDTMKILYDANPDNYFLKNQPFLTSPVTISFLFYLPSNKDGNAITLFYFASDKDCEAFYKYYYVQKAKELIANHEQENTAQLLTFTKALRKDLKFEDREREETLSETMRHIKDILASETKLELAETDKTEAAEGESQSAMTNLGWINSEPVG